MCSTWVTLISFGLCVFHVYVCVCVFGVASVSRARIRIRLQANHTKFTKSIRLQANHTKFTKSIRLQANHTKFTKSTARITLKNYTLTTTRNLLRCMLCRMWWRVRNSRGPRFVGRYGGYTHTHDTRKHARTRTTSSSNNNNNNSTPERSQHWKAHI